MPVSAAALPVTPDDLAVLRRWAGATQAPAAVARRAEILLLAAEGMANTEIAERLGVSRPTEGDHSKGTGRVTAYPLYQQP